MPGWPLAQEAVEECRRANAVPGAKKQWAPNMKRWLMYDLLTCMEMAKTFDFFRKLSEADRVRFINQNLKNPCFQYFLFRDTLLMISNLTKAFFTFENKTDRLIRPDGTYWPKPPAWWVLKRSQHQRQFLVPGFHKTFTQNWPMTFQKEQSLDWSAWISPKSSSCWFERFWFAIQVRILGFWSVVRNSIFSAAPDISQEARDILSVERSKYTMALLNHIMAKKGIEGPGRFAEILNIIDVLERQQKDQRDVNLLITLQREKGCRIPLFDEVMLTC